MEGRWSKCPAMQADAPLRQRQAGSRRGGRRARGEAAGGLAAEPRQARGAGKRASRAVAQWVALATLPWRRSRDSERHAALRCSAEAW
jgi:hypothetical protein